MIKEKGKFEEFLKQPFIYFSISLIPLNENVIQLRNIFEAEIK